MIASKSNGKGEWVPGNGVDAGTAVATYERATGEQQTTIRRLALQRTRACESQCIALTL